MKNVLIPALLTLVIVSGCSQGLGPSGDTATTPAEGAIFIFHTAGVVGDSIVSTDFADTTHITTAGFDVAHSFDSIDHYLVVASNDLKYVLPVDSLTLGIYSRRSFSTRELSTPVRYRGSVYTGYVGWSSRYVGDQPLFTAGREYACHKVEMTAQVRFVDSAGVSTTVEHDVATLWYAPTLHYFARRDFLQFYYDSVVANTITTLTSVK